MEGRRTGAGDAGGADEAEVGVKRGRGVQSVRRKKILRQAMPPNTKENT